jgi:hypothetical protein
MTPTDLYKWSDEMTPTELYTLLDDAGVEYEVIEIFENARYLRIEVSEKTLLESIEEVKRETRHL